MSKIYEALKNAQQEASEPQGEAVEPQQETEALRNGISVPDRESGAPEPNIGAPHGAAKALAKPSADLARSSEATLLPSSCVSLDFDLEMISLYQCIESRLPGVEKKVIQFIGSREGEGTSTIVKEFARVVSRKLGKSLFLLSADQCESRQHTFLRIHPECGLEVLSHDDIFAVSAAEGYVSEPHEDAVNRSAVPTPLNFYSPGMDGFWECLKRSYDLILVDSAPLSISPEGVEISRRVDGVVLVLEAEKTRWQVAENLKKKIESVGGNIIGVVFNKRRFYIPDAIYKRL